MDYRDLKREHWAKLTKDKWGTVTAGELMGHADRMRKPRHGDQWGGWMLDSERLVLMHVQGGCGYELDLERMRTPALMLDSIFQVRGKRWHTRDDMAALIEAFDDLLHPQANLCSFGVAREIKNPKTILKTMIGPVPVGS